MKFRPGKHTLFTTAIGGLALFFMWNSHSWKKKYSAMARAEGAQWQKADAYRKAYEKLGSDQKKISNLLEEERTASKKNHETANASKKELEARIEKLEAQLLIARASADSWKSASKERDSYIEKLKRNHNSSPSRVSTPTAKRKVSCSKCGGDGEVSCTFYAEKTKSGFLQTLKGNWHCDDGKRDWYSSQIYIDNSYVEGSRCSTCNGRGYLRCKTCYGAGYTEE